MKMTRLHLTALLCISLGFSIGCTQEPRPAQPAKNNTSRSPSSSSTTIDQSLEVHLKNADITQVIAIYQEVARRTVLRHPQILASVFNLDINARNQSEAAAAFTKAFEDKGLKVIPDGEKFVMIVPKEKADVAIPRSSELKSNSASPMGEINFPSVPLDRAATIYARLRQRKLEPGSPLLKTQNYISLRTGTPLTNEEAAYAIETLFAWQGIKFVPVGDDLIRAVEISPEKK